VRPIGGDGDFRPLDWLVSARRIGEHIAVTLVILANHDDAGFVGVLTRGDRRIDRHHDSRQVWGCSPPRRIDNRVAPQRAGRVLEQLGIELLPAEPRAFVFADDLVEEPGCQVRPVFIG
jgi:hypothetical protein